MHKEGYEAAKHRAKYCCPKADRKCGCFCEHPCSPAKYGRTVHIFIDDNPRLFKIPPRDSKAWEKEYDLRTSVERSNKREKADYKLEDGRHRYVQYLCPFLVNFFSCTIFSCQVSVGISFIEIPRSYYETSILFQRILLN